MKRQYLKPVMRPVKINIKSCLLTASDSYETNRINVDTDSKSSPVNFADNND